MNAYIRSIVLFGLVAMSFWQSAYAAEGGYSNYIPGTYGDFAMAVAPADTWTLRNDSYLYSADADRAVRSGTVNLGLDFDFLMNFTTVLYKPGIELFGAQFATGIFIPVIDLDIDTTVDTGLSQFKRNDSTSGVGDIALIPLALFWNQGHLHSSFIQLIVAPTGDYDVANDINDGLNYWSFDTNLALTYLNPETGLDASFNLGHIYNTENSDTDYQTGRELHLDVVINQFLTEAFAIGLHGYYLKQVSGDSGDGALLGSFKAKSAGIGPALLWSTSIGTQSVSFIAKWMKEIDAENRLEGDHFMISFAINW